MQEMPPLKFLQCSQQIDARSHGHSDCVGVLRGRGKKPSGGTQFGAIFLVGSVPLRHRGSVEMTAEELVNILSACHALLEVGAR